MHNFCTGGEIKKVSPTAARYNIFKKLVYFTDIIRIIKELVTDGTGEFTERNAYFVNEAHFIQD